MAYRDLEPVSKQLTIVVGLTVVGFMAFGLALSFYRNVLFDQTLQNIQDQNDELTKELAMSQGDLDYFQSAQFKDKYAKENMNRLSPGENLLIITQATPSAVPTPQEQQTINQKQEAALQDLLNQMPTIEHWRLYLFDRGRLEELKKGL